MERRISRISRPNTVCLCCHSLGEGEEMEEKCDVKRIQVVDIDGDEEGNVVRN